MFIQGQHVYSYSDDGGGADSDSPKIVRRPTKKPRHEDFYDDEDLDADISEDSGSGDDYDFQAESRPKAIGAPKKNKRPKKKPSVKKANPEDGDLKMKQEPGSKRPMNAFMLFAKKYRQEVTKQHPGKDNRYVSFTKLVFSLIVRRCVVIASEDFNL